MHSWQGVWSVQKTSGKEALAEKLILVGSKLLFVPFWCGYCHVKGLKGFKESDKQQRGESPPVDSRGSVWTLLPSKLLLREEPRCS